MKFITKKVDGNTHGIRRSHIENLENVFDMEINRKQFCTVELLEALAAFTDACKKEVMVYIDRSGKIMNITVGEHDRVALPVLRTRRSEQRLSGIRCIHTHPSGSAKLSKVDIQSLKSLRLDAMASVSVFDGKPVAMQVGVLNELIAENDFSVNLFGPFDIINYIPFLQTHKTDDINSIPDSMLWDEIFSADARIRPEKSKKSEAEIMRAILVGIDEKQADNERHEHTREIYHERREHTQKRDNLLCHESLDELLQLANTAGFITIGSILQPREKPDSNYYIGYGKLQDLILQISQLRADAVIFDDELTPAQIRNIQKELGKIEIVDRTSLILDIFSSRASTHEGRLQVELAQTKYLLPRMAGYWTHMSRMGGGGGGGAGARRGEGETQLEVDRRILRKRLNDLEKEIDKIKSGRDIQRGARERSNIPVVALVGYTNAGKSTLLNCLSGSNVLVEDKLFATLDPTSRRVNFNFGEFLLVDTVGFVNKLPHDLVDAFRATLEEAKFADLLLHVVDSSSTSREQQMEVVNNVLTQLEVSNKPTLTVYNKCDLNTNEFAVKNDDNDSGHYTTNFISKRESVAVSAKTNTGIDDLKNAIGKKLAETRIEITVLLPHDSGALVSRIYDYGQVKECNYLDNGIQIKAIVPLEEASRLRTNSI